jgi:hypothetical protein
MSTTPQGLDTAVTDPVTTAYHRELAVPDSPLAQIAVTAAAFPDLEGLGYGWLHRPLFLPAEELDRLGTDLLRVVDLLASLPWRLFDGDVARTCAAVGIPAGKAELIGRLSPGGTPRFGRIDAYHDGDSLRVLEFNATSCAGGQEWVGPLAAAMDTFPAFQDFAARHGLDRVDPVDLLAGELRRAAASIGVAAPVVAILEGPDGLGVYGRSWFGLHRLLRARGLDVRIGEITDLEFRDGRACLAGEPVDVAYRVFDLAQVVDHPEARQATERLRDAHEAGELVLWLPLETEIHRNKRWLAYLSDPRLGLRLDPEERALVDRLLPWTRALDPDTAQTDPQLWREVLGDRENLVLKPNDGYGGAGITFGWTVDEPTWERAVHAAAALGAVVQRRVVPRTEWILDPATGRLDAWDACWGLFWMPSGFAGGGGRLVPAGEPFTIEAARKRRAGLYRYPSPDHAAPGPEVTT